MVRFRVERETARSESGNLRIRWGFPGMERTLPELVCPIHRIGLVRTSGHIACDSGCTFDVRNSIPRFVTTSKYAEAFGLQWLRYRQTQLDSHTGLPLTKRRAQRCLGEELWEQLEGKSVLEVGCGAGRFTEILLARRALVFSTDLSEAVEANQKNFPQSERHMIAQADACALPFAPGQFDIVLCLGVIQHTPSPEKTIEALWNHVAPGGWLVIDHYTYNLSYFTKTAPLVRAVLKRLEPERALRVTDGLVTSLLPLHRAVRRHYTAQILLSRISPVQAYYHALPELSDEQQREWAMLDTHDTLTDWYKHFRTRKQLYDLLHKLGAAKIWCEKGGNGIEARAMRAAIDGHEGIPNGGSL